MRRAFAEAVRTGGRVIGARGEDARAALVIALACIEPATRGAPVALDASGAVA